MKKVNVLNESKGYKFGIGKRTAIIDASMPVGDAEHIQALYPGQYVEVTEEPEPAETTPAKSTAKTAKTADTTEAAK
jgi:hypothetical protein